MKSLIGQSLSQWLISDSKYNIEHLKRVCTFIGKKEMVVTFFLLLKFVQL